ncbi:tripartite tricarboxylate transporter TctB family protein [Amycolatopsis sp. NPDC048633]|uniref:tripartite tricarboxylate transporter TctB family protein n=1 Tax=Amycolatopsis sp. NPDC048633 TaxID=3157095 RepID=UPI00340C84D7
MTEEIRGPAEEARPRPDRHAIGQLTFGIISVAVGVAALIDAAGLAKFGKSGQPGPGLFPDIVAALLVVLGAWLAILTVVRPTRAEPVEEPVEPGGFKRAATVWLAFVVSIPLLVLFGFAPAMAALVAFLVFGVERIRGFRPVLAVVLVPAVVYLLFSVVLGVDLPESVLFPV